MSYVIAAALLVAGGAVLGYDRYGEPRREQVLRMGSIVVSAEPTDAEMLSPILGWFLVGGGIGLVALGTLANKG